MKQHIFLPVLILLFSATVLAQPPQPPQGPPGAGQPPRPPQPGQPGPGRNSPPPAPGSWIGPHDENNDGVLDAGEFNAAIERTFSMLDKDGNGTIEIENPTPKPHMQPPPAANQGPGQPAPIHRALPPLFHRRAGPEGTTLTRSEFENLVRSIFAEMDENGDGSLSKEEAAKHAPPQPAPPAPPGAPVPPNAHFIGAELRFGDKHIKGQPFSADIVIEETRRLFDGSIVTRQTKGAVYRDASGKTRREQPLEMVAGVPIVGKDDKPQLLVFINDFDARTHIFLDAANKIARRTPLGAGVAPKHQPGVPPNAKSESLGTKTIEGIKVEGTRTTSEIPAGRIGNDKPILVTTEKWLSPELQVLVSSRHVDPIAGEHIFRLVNITRAEPVAELFSVPAGYQFRK